MYCRSLSKCINIIRSLFVIFVYRFKNQILRWKRRKIRIKYGMYVYRRERKTRLDKLPYGITDNNRPTRHLNDRPVPQDYGGEGRMDRDVIKITNVETII